jgi:hypothetical protein
MVRLIHRYKRTHPDGSIEEQVVRSVPRSERQPDGIRYRLVYIRHDAETPAVLYDNHHPKGHHKHLGPIQLPYEFVSVEKLIEDFQTDVKKANENL